MSYVIIDFQSKNEEHLPFNFEVIKLISYNNKIYFFGLKSHCESLKLLYPNINFIYLKSIDVNVFLRIFNFFNFFIKYFTILVHSKKIIILSAPLIYYSLIPFLNILNKDLIFFQHGIVEVLFKNKNLVKKYLKFQLLILNNFKNIKLIFLSKHIKNSLLKLGVSTKNSLFIRHPFSFNNDSRKKDLIATIGIQSIKKGFEDNLFISEVLDHNKINNIILGSISKDAKAYLNNTKVNKNFYSNFIPKKLYDKILHEVSIVYFTYPSDSYIATASGAYYDAVSNKCLVIAYEDNLFFSNELNNNPNLFLVKNKEELIQKLIELLNKYEFYQNNFKQYDSNEISNILKL